MGVRELILPEHYEPKYDIRETERAIKLVKDTFEKQLARNLNLERVSAPLFVRPESGLNDDLNGVERPVAFDLLESGYNVQIVHSLAKWKRLALSSYGFAPGSGLYTDMNAIRRDESLDNLHSIYVDQWDWEKVITRGERNRETLQKTVEQIYAALRETERVLCESFPKLVPFLPERVTFLETEELLSRYPGCTPKERENQAAKEYGVVFLQGIGAPLSDGAPHDGRAPDYDDWGLNGDLLIWNPVLEIAFEVSSMGIRVDEKSLASQLASAHCEDRARMPFHRALLAGELPLTIGGGIGQSRICMLLLQRAHIGEVQASIWSDEMVTVCREHGITLL